jgi:hypothetical protein
MKFVDEQKLRIEPAAVHRSHDERSDDRLCFIKLTFETKILSSNQNSLHSYILTAVVHY